MSNYRGPKTVNDGLVFAIDAGNTKSYNSSAPNDTLNMVNPTESGSFVNGLTVVDNSYSFDGANDYIVLSNTITNTIYTLDFWYKMGVNDTFNCIVALNNENDVSMEEENQDNV